MYASDLPPALQSLMVEIGAAVERQRVANEAIDEVVASHADPLVERRRDEGSALVPKIGIFLQNQATHVQVRVVGVCWV